MLLGLGVAANAQETTLKVDQKLESIQDGDIVAIYNESDNQFLYGKDNQNLGYDVAEVAFQSTNNGWLFRVQEEEGHYLFHLQGRDGGDFNLWGSTENSYLNSQPATGWCSFILGLGDQWGQDGENLALWDVERNGNGFMLKNVGTGLYLNNALPAKYPESEAAIWTFCTLKEVVDDDVPQKSTKGTWVSIIKNGDFEGDDLSSFPLAKDGVNVAGAPYSPEIVEREDGGHCAKIVSDEGVTEVWSTQFFVRANEILPAGTKYRMSLDVCAERDAEVSVGAHGEPRNWHAGGFAENFYPSTVWETVDFGEGEITSGFAGSDGFRCVAFDLNIDKDEANTFYFDNIVFEIFKPSTAAEYNSECVEVTFPFDTNIPSLVSASGKSRLLMPEDCFTVKVNGTVVPISTVELTSKGRLYVFLEEDWAIENPMGDKDEVIVSFKNPTDEAYRIIYTEGNNTDVAVEDFVIQAEYNDEIDALPSGYTEPELVSADPENGSFNLPNSIKEFKLTFDKTVICKKIKAYLGKTALTVSPADGFSKEITLTRNGGDLATGEYIISVENVIGEKNLGEQYSVNFKYTIYVGKQDINPEDEPVDIVPLSVFDDCAENTIPEGFIVNFNDVTRSSGGAFSDGPRMRNFSKCADFSKALYFTKGYAEYGSVEGSELTLTAGIPYRVEFNSAMWKTSGKWMKFQVLDSKDEAVVFEMIKNSPNMEEKTDAEVAATTFSSFKFVAPETGNYKLRWTACDKDGVQGNFEVLLAKVHVYSIPSTPGWEEVTKLQTAMALAKEAIEAAAGDRYAGEAFDALDTAVKKYDDEAAAYTAPSDYNNAIADLTAKTNILSTHRSLCDRYDELKQRALDYMVNYADTKFAASDIYAQLKAATDNYGEKVLTNDEELAAANTELSTLVDLVKNMFTEGKSTLYDYWNSSKPGSGYCVLVDRIRQGAETLIALGVEEDDPLIVAANNALSDDDDLANAIKKRITVELYGKMKDDPTSVFTENLDEETDESTFEGPNMTVFVKNPNIYVLDKSSGYSEENVPGWTVPTSAKPGLFDDWSGRNFKNIPQDVAFSAWKTAARMEQTITDLPAGVYSVCFGAGSWNGNADWIEGSFCYVKTSDTLVPEEGEEEDRDMHFAQVLDFEEGQVGPGSENNLIIENVEIVDGELTFGVQFGSNDQPFFNMVQLLLTAPATGFDYATGYQDALTGVEAAKTAKVRAIELYDLNGRRLTKAGKGLVIVKKVMSDGSVKTEKVVK